jgi:hypothetical protein
MLTDVAGGHSAPSASGIDGVCFFRAGINFDQ